MPADAAHTSLWLSFDVLFAAALVIGMGLEFAMPLSFMPPLRPIVLRIGATAAIALGLFLIVAARRQLARAGQSAKPSVPTTELVEEGAFAVSRNPVYLGGVLLLAGLAMALDAPWLVPAAVALALAANYLLIVPEERYLAVRFKARYEAYCERVRRWF